MSNSPTAAEQIRLSAQQDGVITDLLKNLPKGATKFVGIIEGPAGSGKTTLVRRLIEELKRRGHRIILAAPTHKAASVLSSKANREVVTIQSHLEIRPKRMADELVFSRVSEKGRQRPKEYLGSKPHTVIVDEASMLGSDILSYIAEDRERFKDNYIFVGDRKQINPVNETITPIFEQRVRIYNLTEIHRQAAENDNILLSQNLDWLDDFRDGEYFNWADPIVARDAIVQSWKKGEDARYLAYTNKRVNGANLSLRNLIVGASEPFVSGEIITMSAPFSRDGRGVSTSEEVAIVKAERTRIDGIAVTMINEWLPVIEPGDLIRYEREKSRRAQVCRRDRKLWGPVFYGFMEQFAQATYPYAMTVHKSQGSTFSDAVIDVSNIKGKCQESMEIPRLLYTAITRTAGKNLLL